MITVLLADDHHVVREGFRALLKLEKDFSVVGEAGDGLEAVRLAEQLKPNVVVADLMMPSLNGIEVTRQITHRLPRTRVVLLSMHANEAYVLEALRHGAAAYVLKDASSHELVRAVREAFAGRRYLSPPLSEPAIEAYVAKTQKADSLDLYETLTTREREVLQLSAEGRTSAEIAFRLSISSRTVETHRTHLMHKLGLRSQAEVIRYALQRGIVPLSPEQTFARQFQARPGNPAGRAPLRPAPDS
jgi:DNA-binding NarL/FixJ family response regulator